MKHTLSVLAVLFAAAMFFTSCNTNNAAPAAQQAAQAGELAPAGSIVYIQMDSLVNQYDMFNDLKSEIEAKVQAIDDDLRNQLIDISTLKPKYWQAIDGESAYELLLNKIDSNPNIESEVAPEVIEEVKAQKPQEAPVQEEPEVQQEQPAFGLGDIIGTVMGGGQTSGKRAKKSSTQKMAERAVSQAANTVAREATKGLIRGIFGQMK